MHVISCSFTVLIFTNFIEDHHCFIGDRDRWIMSVVFISKATSSGYSFNGFILHCPGRVCCWLSPVASCSHVILYFAVLCRMCGNVVIKHYIHSEMDLRPFNSLGQYLNGFTSKKTFRLLIKILYWKWSYLQTEIFICNSGVLALLSRRTWNLQMLSKVLKSFTNNEILLVLKKFLLQSAFFPKKMINAKRVELR